jgi:peptidyl-prolyl cis-trans isomerase A (cyclophilin A)
MKNQLLASFLGLLFACLPLSEASAQTTGQLLDVVCMETNVGEFCIRLFPEDAPATVANFLKYVNDTDYNNTLIHRSARIEGRNFVIQGGGYTFDNNVGPQTIPKDAPVVNEFKRPNIRGTVAMAKSADNPNSATSEWFINLADNRGGIPSLDTQNGGFTVFGEVVIGMDVVDSIARLPALDISGYLGPVFGETPLLDYDSNIVETDFVKVTRAFTTQRDPNAPTATDPFPHLTTTVKYSGAAFLAPVQWTDGRLYRMIFVQDTAVLPPAYSFKVDTTLITLLNDKGQDRAIYDGEFLTIPSVKIPGSIVTDVRLRVTDKRTLKFDLVDFIRYSGQGPL